MIKKLFVISTAAMITISPMVLARGGNGGGSGKTYRGSVSQGTSSRIRTQIKTQSRAQTTTRTQVRDISGKSASGTKGSGDKTRDRLKDGSCNE